MSKRAEAAAINAYPKEDGKVWSSAFGTIEFDRNAAERGGFQAGYEQAEKDTIERVVKWIKENWREYVWTTDNGVPHFGHWENDLRKAMEDEK